MKSPGLRQSLALLRLLSAGPLAFGALRRQAGLPPATAARLLKVLAEEGWVAGGGDGPWRAGPAFAACARGLAAGPDLASLLAGAVEALAAASGESAALVRLRPDGFEFLAKREMPDSYHYLPVGAVNPAVARHPIGQLLLAYDGAERARRAAEAPGLEALAARIRARGWHHGLDRGLRWAAPLLGGDGACRGALVVSSLAPACDTARRESLGRLVRRHARAAAALLP